VPRLLPEETIAAIKRQTEANRTYKHGQTRTPYLLGRVVLCAECGYAMSGHNDPDRGRMYRHMPSSRLTRLNMRQCPRVNIKVPADALEDAVMRDLFDLFGNPAKVQRAVEEAVPDRGKVEELRQRQGRLAEELAKVEDTRGRVEDSLADGL